MLKVRRIQCGRIYALKKIALEQLNTKERRETLNELRIKASV